MPQNLEIKARIRNTAEAIMTARTSGMKEMGILNQTDTYFSIPSGRLKLREINQASSELIYYNRDERSGQRLSDFIIYPVSHPKELKDFLKLVHGIRAVVAKKRTLFMYDDSRVHFDEIEGLGSFIEFEVPVKESLVIAQESITSLIEIFGICDSDLVMNSYIDLTIGLENDVKKCNVLL